MLAELIGLSAGAPITPMGAYRGSWAHRTSEIAAREILTFGTFDGSAAGLAKLLDVGLAGTGFTRGSPFAWDDDRVTWDLVAVSTNRDTVAQAVTKLDQATPYLSLDRFEARVRVQGEAAREAQRTTSTAAADKAAREENWVAKLLTGLKAFGITTVVVAGGALAAYLYVTRRKG